MAKLADVAELAGVSVTTVSRVINNYGSLSEKTKTKVFAAMHKLNYQPNSVARSLQGKSSRLIGLIFPGVSNPFFGELVQTLENKLSALDYRVILCNSVNNADTERSYLRMLQANQVAGIITGTHNLAISEYNHVDAPIISFDRHLGDNIPIVSSDNYAGGKLATELLIKTGATCIVMISGANRPNSPTNQRVKGYEDSLEQAHLPTYVLELPFSMSPTLKRVEIRQHLTTLKPDAVFCSDDLTAILVGNVAQELGLKIPEQLKLVGFDGTRLIQGYQPQLSTVVQPIGDLADLMIDLLRQRIKDNKVQLQAQYTLPVSLHTGASVLATKA